MKKPYPSKEKIMLLFGALVLYASIAIVIAILVSAGVLQKSPPPLVEMERDDSLADFSEHSILPYLQSAQQFLNNHMVEENGHINLYIAVGNNTNLSDLNTNSEAVSYYLLWAAQERDKEKFDKQLEFLQSQMIHPKLGYMMWRLTSNDSVVSDGSNIATDADLRAIKALLIAEKQWHDEKYTKMINQLAQGIETVAITKDGYLAPYAGVSGESTWTADEVWLSYTDFAVLNELSNRIGAPWPSVYDKMKKATLKAQLENGLYNPMLTTTRKYGNAIDAEGYSINSMWMMVRNAESGDYELMQSAHKSLQFYKNKFKVDAELYAKYGSNGDALSPSDSPWVYALVGRAAIALDDKEFSEQMMQKLIEQQVSNNQSAYYGAFPEGYGNESVIGQFTLQESILTMQEFLKKEGTGQNGLTVKKNVQEVKNNERN
ncbi:hypothetical protein C4573_07380 [Candidatus Woesearchaeota archaeon]|nr:MAG: hypothetical protein C4573_07380 [Candidatus Woesearchaeota archaeon]